jgi:RNA polymerase sigma-70 factor, ECF subfamily
MGGTKNVSLDERGSKTPREVVEAAKSGDEHAWGLLFDQHYPRIYRFMHARLASPQQAEDLASDVFLEAFRSAGNFTWQGKPFEAWLFGIAKNVLASYYRSRRVEAQLDEATEPAVRDEYIAVEVRNILDQLPHDYRTALELRFMLGLSGAEAAEVMGRSHGAFRSLLFRAVRAYREESEPERTVGTRSHLRLVDGQDGAR